MCDMEAMAGANMTIYGNVNNWSLQDATRRTREHWHTVRVRLYIKRLQQIQEKVKEDQHWGVPSSEDRSEKEEAKRKVPPEDEPIP